jgi:hypothetical protein
MKYRTRKEKHFTISGRATLIISAVLFLFTLLFYGEQNQKKLTNEDICLITGSLKNNLEIKVDGKYHKSIEFYLDEFPQNLFFLDQNNVGFSFWKDDATKFVNENKIGDKLTIGIYTNQLKDIIKNHQSLLNLNSTERINVVTVKNENYNYVTIDDFNYWFTGGNWWTAIIISFSLAISFFSYRYSIL